MLVQARISSPGPALTGAEPQLFVRDIKAACDFFTEKLGFAVAFVYGDPPFYRRVRRDGARLNLRHVDRPIFDNALRAREDLLSAAISVDDVRTLYAEFAAAGVTFHRTLKTEPWVAEPSSSAIPTVICRFSPARHDRRRKRPVACRVL